MNHLNGNHPRPSSKSAFRAAPIAPPSGDETPYLLFESRGLLTALPASAVGEVLPLPEATPVDGAPGWVGVLDVRGRLLPVVDLGEVSGAAPRRFETTDNVIVIQSDSAALGLIVERVREVRAIAPGDIELAPTGGGAGVARVEGELVRVLDAGSLLGFAARGEADGAAPARPFCPDASPDERALWRERARVLRAPTTASPSNERVTSFVAVRLGGETFGLPLEGVREFAATPHVTPVPGGPPDLLGLVNRRGEVVPLLDLRGALGLPTGGDAGAHIAFVESGGAPLGLAVEDVLGVWSPPASELMAAPSGANAGGESVRAAASYGGQTLAILDLAPLLARAGWGGAAVAT